MREIKFRAWHKEFGEMVYTKGNSIFEKREFSPFVFEVGFSNYPESEWDIMQYIGFKDKNGFDIFEGDYNKDGEIVIWCNECSGWQWGVYDFPTKELIYCHNCEGNFMFHDINMSEIEIIGNIYQHPELNLQK